MGYSEKHDERVAASHKVRRVLGGVLFLNLAVATAKLAYGSLTASVSMVADGFHSLFDSLSNIVGLLGAWMAGRPADESHPYGHGKYETFASMAIGILLTLAAWNVAREAVLRLLDPGAGPEVDVGSFVVMGSTICVNVAVTVYERRVGRRLRSEVLLADASHTGSDVFVSFGVLAGLIAVKLGFPLADPLIALGVAAMIARAAWKVFGRAEQTFSDRARIPSEEIRDVACSVPGALECHDIRTRGTLSQVYVDLHVQVDPSETVASAHRIAEAVERAIVNAFAEVSDAIVHVEPLDEYQAEKTAGQRGVL